MEVILPKNYTDDFKRVLTQPYNAYREKLPVVKYTNCYFTHTGIGLILQKNTDDIFINMPFINISRGKR